MQNMNMQSVMKAAAVGAVINVIIAVIGGLIAYFVDRDTQPIVNSVFACCGGALIPIIVGALYGYLTPGKESLGQAAMGGAISGVVTGLLYSVITVVINVISGLLGSGFDAGNATLWGICCGVIFFGAILGAVGGMIWTAIQKK